jgi:putative ABC transport system permease protein
MSLARVAVKNVGRNAFRAALTVVGVAVAMLAFVLLRTVLSAWTMGTEFAAQDRVATRHKITFVMSLPKRYAEDIKNVPGVKDVAWFNWFGARLPGKEDAFFATMGTDPESALRVYDEIEVPEAQKQAWFDNRQGAIVGAQLARQFGWKVGDKVTLSGTIYPGDWEFVIEGIYTAKRKSIDQSSLWFNWKYVNEHPSLPQSMRDQIGWVTSKVTGAGAAARVAKDIDAMFETRDIQTLSMDERAMNTSFLGMLSTLLNAIDIVSLVILVIMMLILGNTIAMSVRERTHEYGVLRAIGFMPRHIATLVLGEALAIGFAGGALGVAIGYPLINEVVGAFIEDNFTAFFPYFRMMERDALIAVAAGMAVAAVASALPAYSASKLDVIDALRRVG